MTFLLSFQACKAYQLEKYCYHYFLANLSLMMSRDEFISLLESNQVSGNILALRLVMTLVVYTKMNKQLKKLQKLSVRRMIK